MSCFSRLSFDRCLCRNLSKEGSRTSWKTWNFETDPGKFLEFCSQFWLFFQQRNILCKVMIFSFLSLQKSKDLRPIYSVAYMNHVLVVMLSANPPPPTYSRSAPRCTACGRWSRTAQPLRRPSVLVDNWHFPWLLQGFVWVLLSDDSWSVWRIFRDFENFPN